MTPVDDSRKIRIVNVFTDGDSTDPSVWSNVPFLLCHTLESKGVKVNRINYKSLSDPLSRFAALLCDFVYRHFDRRHGRGYLYAKIYYALVDRKIRRGGRKYSADLDITPYNCGNRHSPQPTLLLGDWTQEYLYRVRLRREPEGYQRFYATRQHEVIEQSDCVVSLFAACAEDMRVRYCNPNIFHLGRNVVNNLCSKPLDAAEIVRTKEASHRILFVGKRHYIDAARQLVRIFDRITTHYPDASLDLVGLNAADLGMPLPASVHCHGYLHKGISAQCETYYHLLSEARVFVNTTSLWGGYSSTVEAMYFYTPVVVAPYKEFIAEFGEEIPFGGYCSDREDELLCEHLLALFECKGYVDCSLAAHQAVAGYTWDEYVNALLALAEGLSPTRRK